MVVVGRDGSPVWQLVRMAVVAAIILLAYRGALTGTCGRRAAIAFGVGLAGTAVGTGIGLPHLVKNGLHPLTVAGLRHPRRWARPARVGRVLTGAQRSTVAAGARRAGAVGLRVRGHVVARSSGRGHQRAANLGGRQHTSRRRAHIPRRRVPDRRRGHAVGLVHPVDIRRRRGVCCTDPARRAPACSITPSCSPITAMAC